MIAEANTGIEAWDTLAERYASMDITNVMRIEETFGTARRKDDQSISEWIGLVRGLASQLREVGVEVTAERVAHSILSGAGKEYGTTKAALRARRGALSVDLVSQHLMEAEAELLEETESKKKSSTEVQTATTINTQYNVNPRQINPGSMHRPTAVAMAANKTTPQQHRCDGQCSCTYNHYNNSGGPQRTAQQNYCQQPYARPLTICPACGLGGHAEATCWVKHPEMKPKWMLDKEEWRKQRKAARQDDKTVATPATQLQTQKAMTARQAYQTAYNNPMFLRGGLADANHGYVGPSNAADPFATANYAHTISGTGNWGIEYARSVQQISQSMSKPIGGVDKHDEPDKWLIDTGASNHYSPFKHLFITLKPVETPVEILTGNGIIYAREYGTIPLIIRVGNTVQQILLEYVLYVPDLQTKVNLFSVIVLAERGYYANFGPNNVKFVHKDITVAQGVRLGNSWYLDCNIHSHQKCLASVTGTKNGRADTLEVWHQRMGHLNLRDIKRLESMAEGVVIGTPPASYKLDCAGCLVGKDHRHVSRMPREPRNRVLQTVFTDICSPMRVLGLIGNVMYFCVFVDAYTRFCWVFCIAKKDDIRQAFREWSAIQESAKGVKIQQLFSDNEPCLLEKVFQGHLAARGIQHHTLQTYSSEMNGAAENAIKNIVQCASAMLWTAKIPEGFWPEAVRVSTYLKNWSPHKAVGKTPYEAWYGEKPDLSHIRIFGSRCYGHVPKALRTKWESHTAKGILMGYYDSEGLYAMYDVNKRILVKKRDVLFFEGVFGHPTMEEEGLSPGWNILGVEIGEVEEIPEVVESDDEDRTELVVENLRPAASEMLALTLARLTQNEEDVPDAERVSETNDSEVSINSMVQMVEMSFVHQGLRDWQKVRSTREDTDKDLLDSREQDLKSLEEKYRLLYEKLKDQYGVGPLLHIDTAALEDDPLTWKAAMMSPNKAFWLKAAFDEVISIARMCTFDFVDSIPSGRQALPTKWVWLAKQNDQGKVEKFKAQWVARGDMQRKGVDYNETFAPVANLALLRVILSIAASLDLCIKQMDVVSAFLNGAIDTLVYLRQADGFKIGDGFCRLNKSLYGLCQAARVWYLVLNDALGEVGFIHLQADLACWVKMSGRFIAVVAHVDDTLLLGHAEDIAVVKQHLQTKFKTKDIEGGLFIGLKLSRDKEAKVISIGQAHYAKDVLEAHGMWNASPVASPMIPSQVLVQEGMALSTDDKRLYQSIVGSLAYLMNCTRPDLAFAVGKLGQYASNPTATHMLAAKPVLRYLRGTYDTMLRIDGSEKPNERKLNAFLDASWADDKDDSRSTYGFCILWGRSLLLWKSKKHRSVSLSSTDAEYLAASELTREVCWILNIFEGLSIKIELPVVIRGDNKNANNLANNTSSNSRTRHIDIKQRYVLEKAKDGIIRMDWISTFEQVADMFTKSLPRVAIQRHAEAMGLTLSKDQHACMVCQGSFKSNNALHVHVRVEHPDLRYDCHSMNTSTNITCHMHYVAKAHTRCLMAHYIYIHT